MALSLGVQGLHDVGLGLLEGLLGCVFLLLASGRRCCRLLARRVGYGRLASLLGLLGLRVLLILHWRLLLFCILFARVAVGLGDFRGCALSGGIISLGLLGVALHHLRFLRIFTLLRLYLRKLVITRRFALMCLLFNRVLFARLFLLADGLFLLFGGLLREAR